MRKNSFCFAALAIASFGLACILLGGCDISLNLGDGNTVGGNTGGNKGGDEVTQEQWVEIFSDTEKYTNYTLKVTGTSTVSGYGNFKGSNTVMFDGLKSYMESTSTGPSGGEKNEITESCYCYFDSVSENEYAWTYDSSEGGWVIVANQVLGIGSIELNLRDYSDCYGCFAYNSTTHVYEATAEGLPLLSEKTQMQISKFSFTLKDGVPSSAEMLATMSFSDMTVTQDYKFTFYDFNKTKVNLPDQVKSDLLEMGIQPE